MQTIVDGTGLTRCSTKCEVAVNMGSEEAKRDQWSSKLDFILSCVGFSVGLGNVWRFPYLCYKNGGGAFLIPYFLCLVCGGVPIYFLEVALGQFTQQGGLGCWMICPAMKGIGVATFIIIALLNLYYVVIMAWAGAYFVYGCTSVLPWSHCNNAWNTPRCLTSFRDLNMTAVNQTISINSTVSNETVSVDPVVEFWERRLLQISGGVDQPDGFVYDLLISLAVMWFLVYICIFLGVKWTGKVVYFTAVFPYIVILCLLVRGVTLPGAVDGLIYYLRPEFKKLANAQVWIDAGTQVFFSYAIANGALQALGSYNKFNNNCYRDCIIIAFINSGTSFFAGFAIFSVLGFMAYEQGHGDVGKVADKGPGLAFIAYPKAVTQMPLAPLWSALFFIMIFLLGLDSQFVGCESVITVCTDIFPKLRRRVNRAVFTAGYVLLSFAIGLAFITRGGMFVFQIFDYYAASGMTLLFVCFFECITVAWIYGGGRFYDNIQMMIGYRINPWFRICWTVFAPLLCMFIFVFSCVTFEELTYKKTNTIYIYPVWAQVFGLILATMSMICIPIGFIVMMLKADGSIIQRWKEITTPHLRPDQIPPQWPDAEKLKTRFKQEQTELSLKEKDMDRL